MLPKDIVDCMKECILSIFWAKKDIFDFFKNNNCTSRELPKEIETNDLSRSGIVDYVFNNLKIRSDNGIGQFRSILKSLVEWDYYNPYYFDQIKKLDKSKAMNNIEHLKQIQEIRDFKIKEERKRKEEYDKNKFNTNKSLEDLKHKFLMLFSGRDEFGKSIDSQRRGYLFEEFLKELCLIEGVQMSNQFKKTGEQIDGVIKYDGENYIVEAKWRDALSASDSLYHFAYKAEGKMYGRGIFISVNGFSRDSVNALVTGKAIKTILIDGGDIVNVVEGRYSLKHMLDIKVKEAQTSGRIYVDSITMKDK
jgi:hypothetical protein